jgi:cell division ATPase FtsA
MANKNLEVAVETERKRCVAVCKLHTNATVSMLKQKDLRAAGMIQVAMDLVTTDIELGTEL